MTRAWWFSITVFISSGIFAGVFIANAVYFGRARNNCNTINRGQANTMMWINIILAIISLIIFFWSIYNIVFTEDAKMYLKTVGYNYAASAVNKPSGLVSANTLQYLGGPAQVSPDHVHAVVNTTTTKTTSIAPAGVVNPTSDTLSANALNSSAQDSIRAAQMSLNT